MVCSAAAQQDLVFYSQSNVNPPGEPYEFDWTIYAGSEETLPIECDCTMTTVSGDPYQGFVTTSFTFHVVNPVTTFLIGVLVPGGGIANCSEPVSGVSKSYIAETVDLSTGIDLAGVGNNIDINWILHLPSRGLHRLQPGRWMADVL